MGFSEWQSIATWKGIERSVGQKPAQCTLSSRDASLTTGLYSFSQVDFALSADYWLQHQVLFWDILPSSEPNKTCIGVRATLCAKQQSWRAIFQNGNVEIQAFSHTEHIGSGQMVPSCGRTASCHTRSAGENASARTHPLLLRAPACWTCMNHLVVPSRNPLFGPSSSEKMLEPTN
jgi:hypothetical protein